MLAVLCTTQTAKSHNYFEGQLFQPRCNQKQISCSWRGRRQDTAPRRTKRWDIPEIWEAWPV